MKEFELKYGCNPNQKPAKIFMHDGSDLPIEILNGRPGFINFLDAFNSWQLVRELKIALGLPAVSRTSKSWPDAGISCSSLSSHREQSRFSMPEHRQVAFLSVYHAPKSWPRAGSSVCSDSVSPQFRQEVQSV